MLIGFIRHGLTDWNAIGKIQGQTDIPLNEEGRLQARLLGERLLQEPYKWDFIVSSSLSRAEETGSIIASMISLAVISKWFSDHNVRFFYEVYTYLMV